MRLQRSCSAACKPAARGRSQTATMITTTALDGFLASICGMHDHRPWSDDAVLDAVVPGWRFSVRGADAIDRQFRSWFADPGALEELRRQPTPNGEVVELTITWIENGIPHAARQVHVLDLD